MLCDKCGVYLCIGDSAIGSGFVLLLIPIFCMISYVKNIISSVFLHIFDAYGPPNLNLNIMATKR